MCGFRWELGSVCQLCGGLGVRRGAQQKPAPICFLSGESRGPHPDREAAGGGVAVQADLGPLLDLPASCRGCRGSPSPCCTSCSG